MTTPEPDRDPLEELAEEFVGRVRRGEHPALTEYADRRPDLADRIRSLFPTLLLVERLGPPDESPAAPARLGEYRLLRELGRGGMGVVYEAVQESLGRRVAVKVLPPDRCSGRWMDRFRREAKAAARLHHTNIVPVFGVGEEGGTHFYAMQYIAGHGLDRVLFEARRLRDATLSASVQPPAGPSALAHQLLTDSFAGGSTVPDAPGPAVADRSAPAALPTDGGYFRAAARLGRQAADALHHAHQQGVLHRDVKPSNLILDTRGSLWVADFGLAKASGEDDLTHTGDVLGTLRYMAPERFRGRCDARSDVYAVGATLYELAALRPAFDEPDRLTLVDRIARGDAPPLRRVRPGVPRDLDTVVRKAMARRPEDRYQTAAELADDLGRFLDGRPVAARRASALENLARWARREPQMAGLSAAVLLLLVLLAAGGWWAASRLSRQVHVVTQAQRETTDRLWEARLAEARAVRSSRLPGQRLRGLEAIAEAAALRPSAELRNEAVACLALYDVWTLREWDEDLETVRLEYGTGAAFDADLAHYAVTDETGTVTVRTADGEEVNRLRGPDWPADYLRFSPDGRYLAARFTSPLSPGQVRPLWIWEWRTGRVVLALANTTQPMLSFDFHPSGAGFVVGHGDRIDWHDLPDGRRSRSTSLDDTPGWLAFEPTAGGRLAVGGNGTRRVLVIDWMTGRPAGVWDDLPTGVYAVAWQPGGGVVAATGQDGGVYTLDVATGKPGAVLRGHQFEARELAFTPDGSVLVTRGWDATTRFWDPVEGRELLRVRAASFLQVSRDGRRIGYRGYNTARLGVWELVGGDVCRVFYGPAGLTPQTQAGLSFSPDGAVLVAAGAAGVCLWDVRSGRLLDRIELGAATDVRFDPRGRWVYVCGPTARSYRVPARRADDGRWQLGPPVWWPLAATQPYQFGTDRSGDVVAIVERFRSVLVTRPGRPPVRVGASPQVSYVAVSPCGELVATGPWRGSSGVQVWRADDGRKVADLPAPDTAGAAFTPDGRRVLVLGSDGVYRAHAVGTWEKVFERGDPATGFTRGHRMAFHPDGHTAAFAHDRAAVRLTDLDTGEELATLPYPDSHNLAAYEFSPDGRYLAAVTVRGAVQVWDLTALSARLRALGLDWRNER